uniref:AP complex subunit sigma n=1 Tax=Rhabditophanes sp. KR3021 TaxID=114890 RepID=A0AC35UBS6_9BILA
MIQFMVGFETTGAIIFQKWFEAYNFIEKKMYLRDIWATVSNRSASMCSIIEYKNFKIVYKRYHGMFMACAISAEDNELIILEAMDFFIECFASLFPGCSAVTLSLQFNTAYHVLDEIFLAGQVQETDRRTIKRVTYLQDEQQYEEHHGVFPQNVDLRNIY